MYQAIRTKYIGPTNTKGSRFQAAAEGGKVVVSCDYALSTNENHQRAAEALALKLDWVKTPEEFRRIYVAGGFKNECYFINILGGKLE